jgi:hypothetical protein
MKTMIRPGHGAMLQMNDWLAGLQDGASADLLGSSHAEPPGPGYAVPASYSYGVRTSPGRAEPTGHARAVAAGPGYAVPAGYGRAEPAARGARPEALAGPVAPAAPAAPARTAAPVGLARTAAPAVPARPAALAAPAGPAGAAVRAVIGDQLRLPVMWCEMGSCGSWHADPAALGEADARARAINSGWRIDALGRLACPGASRPTPGSGPPARTCRGTGTRPPGPPGPAAPRCGAAVTSAVPPAAIPRPARRSRKGTTTSRLLGPRPLTGGLNARPAPPFPPCGTPGLLSHPDGMIWHASHESTVGRDRMTPQTVIDMRGRWIRCLVSDSP